MEIRVVRLVLMLNAGLLSLSACGSVPNPAARTGGTTVVVGQADAGRTVQVRVGDTVRVTLQDDYPVPGSSVIWNVASSNAAVVAPGVTGRSTRVPTGTGKHDTYTGDFGAKAPGQAVLDARGTTTCEAMTKQSCPNREFKITLVVTG